MNPGYCLPSFPVPQHVLLRIVTAPYLAVRLAWQGWRWEVPHPVAVAIHDTWDYVCGGLNV